MLCLIGTSQVAQFSSVQFSSVVSNSLWPHGLQHTRLPCPSPTPRAYSSSCPLNWWCHPTISSSVIPFSSRLQSFPPSGSFQMSQFFPSGGQSIGVSASASVLPMKVQEWFPSVVNNLTAKQETWVWYLGWEDSLEEEMVTHFSTLAWKIPWTEEPGGLQSMGSQRVGHDWVTNQRQLYNKADIRALV